MLRRLELNNLAANICEEHWPEDFFVREVGCSQPAAGFHVDNVLSKRTVLHFLFKGRERITAYLYRRGRAFSSRRASRIPSASLRRATGGSTGSRWAART